MRARPRRHSQPSRELGRSGGVRAPGQSARVGVGHSIADRRRAAPTSARGRGDGPRGALHERPHGRRVPGPLSAHPGRSRMSTRPTVAFFGSSLVSAYWNGAATYYRGIIRALHGLGYDVTFYEPDAYGRQQHRDIPDPDWAHVVVYPPDEPGVAKALRAASESDVVVKTSGVGIFDELLDASVLDI